MSEHGQQARDILEIIAWVGMMFLVIIIASALMPGLHELADRWERVAKVAKKVKGPRHKGSHRMESGDGRVGDGDPQVVDPPGDGGTNPKDEETTA